MMLAIFGPTATGKTSLAIKLAKKYNGEIISADSRQVYKGLDIGSGKISRDIDSKSIIKKTGYWQIEGIKIHGFDLKNPGEYFSVSDFNEFARQKIKDIQKENKLVIVAGGTGLYIFSLINDIDTLGIKPDLNLRKKLSKLSPSELYHMLLNLNPQKALVMNDSDRNNPRRLIRAIEIAKSKSKINKETNNFADVLLIGLTAPSNYLYQKVDNWLEFRIQHKMEDEVGSLIRKKVSPEWLLNLGLEYRWLTKFIIGQISKEESVQRLKGDIHSLIRKQKTFFNKFPQIQLFDITNKKEMQKLENTVGNWYNSLNK